MYATSASILALQLAIIVAASSVSMAQELPPQVPADIMSVPADAPAPRTPPKGPFKVEITAYDTLPGFTVIAPVDADGSSSPLPVVAWGNGGCSNDNTRMRPFLSTIASFGFVIVAPGPVNATERGSTDGTVMQTALDWAALENETEGSPFYQRIDADNAAVMGWSCGGLQAMQNADDPRINSVMLLNSGVFEKANFTSDLAPVTKSDLEDIHSPVAYLIGGPSDVAFPNAEDDFQRIKGVPLFKGNLGSGHSGTYAHPGGGWYAEVASAWLMWTLKGEQASRSYFAGADCILCSDPAWSVERKNLD